MKTIIEMAREAGLPEAWISETGVLKWSDLGRFAELVRADEREALIHYFNEHWRSDWSDGQILARQAWTENVWDGHVDISKIIQLARADEREACAKLCEDAEEYPQYFQTTSLPAAIRARGNT